MTHMFCVEIAEQYGLQEAIILEYLHFWIKKNVANGVNYHDGYYWTYNSVKAFAELFPYMSTSSINRTLTKLEELGLIKTGHYNRVAYDRTKWYSLTEAALALYGERAASPPATEENTEAEAQREKEAKSRARAVYPEGFEQFWKAYPRNSEKAAAYKCYCARINDGYRAEELLEAAVNYAARCRKDNTAQNYVKMAKTFLGPATPFLDYLKGPDGKEQMQEREEAVEEYVRFMKGVGH